MNRINYIGVFILTIIFMIYLEVIIILLISLNFQYIFDNNIFWIVPLPIILIPFITFLYEMLLIRLKHIINKDIKIGNTYYNKR